MDILTVQPIGRHFLRAVAMTAALLVSLPASAQTLPPGWEEAVTDYIEGEMSVLGVPGAAVTIVQGTEVVYSQGFGRAGPDGRPVTPQTPFEIASVTKSLTAVAVMQQVEAGRLSLDDSLQSLLPQIAEGTAAGPVTVRDLLGHTSGWSTRDGFFTGGDPDATTDLLEQNARRIISTPLSHPIGQFEYSNANYDLLGYLVQEASGESFGDYLNTHVFAALGMTHSFTSRDEAEAAGLAAGYYPYFGIVRPHSYPHQPGRLPSAYVMAGSEDLGQFLIAHLNQGRYGNQSVLSPKGMDALHSPVVYPEDPCCGYAMGLWLFPFWSAGEYEAGADGPGHYRAPATLEHGGSHPSYASGVLMLPQHELGVVVLFNLNDETAPSAYGQAHLGVADILLDRPPRPAVASEGAVRLYARPLGLAIVGLFLIRAALSAWRLKRLQQTQTGMRPGPVLRHVVIPLVIDLLLVAGLWWFLSEQADAPMAEVRLGVPDIFLMVVVATVVGLGWAILRFAFALRTLRAVP